MQLTRPSTTSVHLLALLLGAAFLPNLAGAQDDGAEAIEEIVITGTRRAVGSVTDMPSPVNILPAADLERQGAVDLQDAIRALVPSFSVTSHPLSGTSSLVRPRR